MSLGAGFRRRVLGVSCVGMASNIDKVERLKNDANRSLMEKRPIEAIGIYTEAINIQPSAILHSNRAAAYLRLGRFEHAITDAEEALKLDRGYAKAWRGLRVSLSLSLSGDVSTEVCLLPVRVVGCGV